MVPISSMWYQYNKHTHKREEDIRGMRNKMRKKKNNIKVQKKRRLYKYRIKIDDNKVHIKAN